MDWTLTAGAATTTVSWDAGHLDGDPALVDLVLERAAQGGHVAPVVGASVPVGLAVPLEAWATITVALVDQLGHQAVRPPPPPVPFAEAPTDAVI
jgi:hypothetical protein